MKYELIYEFDSLQERNRFLDLVSIMIEANRFDTVKVKKVKQ